MGRAIIRAQADLVSKPGQRVISTLAATPSIATTLDARRGAPHKLQPRGRDVHAHGDGA